MNMTKLDELRFGHVTVRPAQRCVLVDDKPVPLGARALDVLFALVEHRDRIVAKEELLEHAWPGLVVEENNLQVQISVLRKVLGANAIATVPARGYRLTLAPDSGDDAARSAAALRSNLPLQLSSFIGREEDLALHAQHLQQTRLLTLTGIGGCGKTRLALQIADRVLESFADGVWYVDFAPLLDADRVALTVATTLGLNEEHDGSIVEQLCRFLDKRHCLLVLDNCEHLVPACSGLVQRLLAAAPRLSVLTGSREGLGVPGEQIVPVRSLSFPPAGSKPTDADLHHYEAIELFVDRARAHDPGFSLSPSNAEAVSEICRRLDGIPLALELAAARTKVLSIEEIRRRLDDRFRLLTGGNRIAVGRQQTLLAAVQWSHDHLSEEERRALRRLSVFAGGWSVQAAVAVVGECDEYTMLDVLSRLIDHGLVVARVHEREGSRYTMLETVRQYAQERLNEHREAETVRDRHLAYFVEFAEVAGPGMFGPETAQWLVRVAADFENVLSANAWSVNVPGGAQASLGMLAALRAYLMCSASLPLAHRLFASALDARAAQSRTRARCEALLADGQLLFFMGRYEDSRRRAEEALSVTDDLTERQLRARALLVVAHADAAMGQMSAAQANFEQSLAVARTLGEPHQLSRSLEGAANAARLRGEFERASAYLEEALTLMRTQGDVKAIVATLASLVTCDLGLADSEHASIHLREAIATACELGLEHVFIALLLCAAGLAGVKREWARAVRWHGAMKAGEERLNEQVDPFDARIVLPVIEEAIAHLASDAAAVAATAGRALTPAEALAEAERWLAGNDQTR